MNSKKIKNTQPTHSSFKNFFIKLFCINDHKPKKVNNKENRTKVNSKQVTQLALLGSYNTSSLCKISRKNFIAPQKQTEGGRIPNVLAEYLSDKMRATTAVVKGQISTKITRRIPYTMKLVQPGQTTKQNGVVGSIDTIKTRINQLSIYKQKLIPSGETCSLIQQNSILGHQIYQFATKFQNSIFILDKDTALDEIGILLSDTDKFIEVQTIVVNGMPNCQIVYVGNEDFVQMSEEDQIQFITKQLQKDLKQQNRRLIQLVTKIHQRSSIKQLLLLLNKSMNQSSVDTVLSCFIKNAQFRNYISSEQIEDVIPNKQYEIQINTPMFRQTGKFNTIPSVGKISFSRSFGGNLLNGSLNSFTQNSIQTFARTQSWRADCDLKANYQPI